ncbi:MAG: hypothetical protein DRN11_02505 [Thermoplasmata archaeon]|nr:MAG: hypothetical protein DRN11_02505 [Thermoplasmata archaeon]
MIEIGLPKLDEYLNGIPDGKTVLFHIEPGMEESNIAMHVLYNNIKKGIKGIYVVSETSLKNVERKFAEYGCNIKEYDIIFIDGYSSLIGAPSDAEYIVEEPHDIRCYEDVLLEVFDKVEKGIVVFDSLSNLMDMCGERDALEGIERINNEISKAGHNGVYNFIAWPYKESILYRVRRIFNAIIEVKSLDAIGRQVMEIKKHDWGNGEGKKIEFKIFKPDGIRIYIPKITVIGPAKSGKTAFIKALSREFTSVDRLGTTVGIEHGIVDYKGYRAEIFGIPSYERFQPLIDKLGSSSMGVFLVIDATAPHTFQQAKEMLSKFQNLPCVIVANKSDLPNALSKEEIKNRMSIDAPVVEVDSVSKRGVYEAFEILANKIMECLNAG